MGPTKILTLLLGMACSGSAAAEYNGWFIQFALEGMDQSKFIGHVYVASAHFDQDSIQDQGYVLSRFDMLDNLENDTLVFFRHRITYRYTMNEGSEWAEVHGLLDKDSISLADIRSIEILEMIDFWYLEGISSAHTIGDTAWMKEAPVQNVAVNGYSCSHQVFVHARDERTDAVLEEMKVDDDRYQVQMNELQEIMQWADGPEHREAEQALEQLEQQRDEDIDRILEKLKGARVVIVSFCSC